jgi:hypothetical protein
MSSCEEVLYIVKHTFIEFPDQGSRLLRKIQSDPFLAMNGVECEDFRDDVSTTCTSLSGGDIDDVLSTPDDDFSNDGSTYDGVKLIVKHTFVEFHLEVEAPKLRRSQSEPSLATSSLTSCPSAAFEFTEATTSTTCVSTSGDDDEASLPSILEKKTNWADITELEFGEDTSSANSQPCSDEHNTEGPHKQTQQKRRSGRARQREKCRRRMRTPSPEMRSVYEVYC